MWVLLPPSEGKAAGGDGPPVDVAGLSLPELTGRREAVLDEVVTLCAGDVDKAGEVLGLSTRQRAEVEGNAALRTAPTLPAGQRYTGVLYDALDLASLSPAARQRAARTLLVFSGLWGAVRVTDRIPAYRCAAGVRLPGLGPLAGHWRPAMAEVLPRVAGDGGLLLDLRSSPYVAMGRPAGDLARRTATVRVLQSRTVDGVERRTVVSHANKATKGRIVRALLETGDVPRTPAELVEALRALGWKATDGEAQAGGVRRLDVVVTAV